jgi:hypothetical protein
MTTLETKIFDFIEKSYEAEFLGKVKVDITLENKNILIDVPTEVPKIIKTSIKYGRLYNYSAVIDSRNIAPIGWHVPTDAEWTTLSTFLGGENITGGKMKETGTLHWLTPNTDATNETGFSALPGGRNYQGTNSIGNTGYW